MTKTRVRAVIIDQNRILLIKRIKKVSTYWVLPGGGLEQGETNEEAIIRECKEELGVDVFVEKYFDIVKTQYLEKDQENLFYFCKIIGGKVGTGNGPEFQEGDYYEGEHIPEWLSMEEFKEKDIKPEEIKDKILNLFE
jgi:8-oxo-dGTP diphosphatase